MTALAKGLTLATGASLANVVTDVFRKKAVTGRPILFCWFLIRAVTGLAFLAVFFLQAGPHVKPIDSLLHSYAGPVFPALVGSFGTAWTPLEKFLFYLLLNGVITSIGLVYYLRALKTADLSFALPFVAFTPVLLVPTSYFFLHEIPGGRQLVGVALVVLGSLALNEGAVRDGWLGPVRALFSQPASRYMLIVSVCFSLTNPLDKILVIMSDPLFAACAYGIVLWVLFAIFLLVFQERPSATSGNGMLAILLAGLFDALALLLQFGSHSYMPVVLTITLKRAGILLSVLAGWFIFHEREARHRLPAAGVMVTGVLLIYLTMPAPMEVLLVVAACSMAVWAWRKRLLQA